MAEKKYLIDNAELMAEWNWEKNIDADPKHLTVGSHKKVWWKCNKGHEWQAIIKDRNSGKGCPYCSGRYAVKGENDLKTVNPTLANEWDYEKNNGLTPMDVLPNSNKKVWWKCSNEHKWQASVVNRTKGNGCPYCAGKKVLSGYNDLQTVNPTLAKEWNYEKNNGLTPADVMPNSDKKVWWKCGQGHEWQVTIGTRNRGSGCPYCAGKKGLKGYNDLQTINPTLAKEWNHEKNGNLSPENFTASSGKKVWWKCSKGHEWQATIHNRNKQRGCPICNSERNTSLPEYAIVYYLKKYGLDVIHSYREKGYELDVFIPSKKIAIEYDGGLWHKNRIKNDLEKNFKCKKDGIKLYRLREELLPLNDSSIDYVVQKGQKDLSKILEEVLSVIIGMSIDVNLERDSIAIENLREYTEKEHSLLSSNQEIANEWHYEKNGNLKPKNLTANSNKKVWWKCSEGHEWQATISDRNRGRGCPICAGKKVLKGFNDLLSKNPELAKEWDDELNDCTPSEIHYNNQSKKVHWICSKCGYKWLSKVSNRTQCPECKRRNSQINVYDAITTSFLYTFANAQEFCDFFGLDIKKQRSSISTVCSRRQKTLMGKYILRHANDDEFHKK